MNIIIENEAHVFAEVAIEGPGLLASPFLGSPFPCLIWDHAGQVSDTSRFEVARELLDAGCRYAVCGGVNCEAWHDAIEGSR